MKINRIVGDIKNKNILLLQGPMGSYFNTLDKKFTNDGANTYRIGFNAGDKFFAQYNHYTAYKDKPENWERFVEEYYQSHKIDKLFVFGDCRFYQAIAIKVAKKFDIEIFVFEEGYLRPNFITLEKYGVNAHSTQPRDRSFYDNLILDNQLKDEIKNLKNFNSTFSKMAREAIIYYWVSNLLKFRYPHYQHHRCFSLSKEFKAGCLNIFRKYVHKITERNLNKEYSSNFSKKYYFVPLQTHGDFQIQTHSKYNNIEDFIEEVMISFSKFAPKDTYLVFKHHPVDRGRKNYKKFINNLAEKLNIRNNIVITWDVHLPTFLKNAIGTIVINSTVGISSLYHNTPTICLGEAIYDIEGLTSKDISIDDFWQNYTKIDRELFDKFKGHLIQTTQINSNFYL